MPEEFITDSSGVLQLGGYNCHLHVISYQLLSILSSNPKLSSSCQQSLALALVSSKRLSSISII